MKREIFEGQECPTWEEMYKMISDLIRKEPDIEFDALLVKYQKMIAFMQTVRPLFEEEEKEKQCRIYGSEISFELFVTEKDLKEKVADIWTRPSKYWDVKDGGESAYYSFLKYLWVDFPDGSDIKLADVQLANYSNENSIEL